MKLYEEALFEAFVWTQAVENQVNTLILHCAHDGRLKLNAKQRSRVESEMPTLGELIKMLKPCVEDALYNRLKELTRMRNDVVHRSNYIENIADWDLESEKDVHEEIKRLKEVKIYAGEVYGNLLNLFRFEDSRERP